MPMHDFQQIHQLINKKNKNRCEESGGVIYCYQCRSDGKFEQIRIILNDNKVITMLPEYYFEYDNN